jgi:hypothetical protein
MKNLKIILMLIIFTASLSAVFGVDEYSLHTARILAGYKNKLREVEKRKNSLTKKARKIVLTAVKDEMNHLTRAADLDRAVAVRDLQRTLKSSSEIPDISADDTKYNLKVVDLIKKYKNRLNKVANYHQETTAKLMKALIKILNDEMLKMDKRGSITDSLIIQNLLKKVKEPDFSLLNYKFAVKRKTAKKELEEKKLEKITKKSKINLDELIWGNSLALGSNILANDIKSEKGLIYICFAESLDPQNERISSVREKIQQNIFVPILPCSMPEEDFVKLLKKHIEYLFINETQHAALPKYCVMLSHLNPASKNNKKIKDFLAEKKIQNSIEIVLGYSKNMFCGTIEADDIRVQIDKTNPSLIADLLNKSRQLQKQFPKNKDVKKLVEDLSQIKVSKPKDAAKHIAKKVKCNVCKGTGSIEKQCQACKDNKNAVCGRCIGSGILVSFKNCPDCNGKGKSWLGMQCKNCKGKGKIKKKTPCLDCEGTGKTKCKKCKNGKISEKCNKCQGTGKIVNSKL